MFREPDRLKPRTDVSFHLVGENAFLFDPVFCRLFGLSTAEATAWCLMCDHGDPVRAAADIARASGRSAGESRQWLDAALAQWAAAQLLDGTLRQGLPASLSPRATRRPRSRYRLLDVTIEISFDDADDAIAAASLLVDFATDAEPEVGVSLIHDGDGCAVIVDGHETERAPLRRHAIPTLKIALVRLCLSHAAGLAAVHAAALAFDGKAILLPAPRGSGKSTLAAACALLPGWEFLADDTVVLDQSWNVRPLPFPICLKAGSWDLLPGLTAALRDHPVYQRPDDLMVRYFRPPVAGATARPLAAILIPRWQPGNPGQLVPITGGAGFRELISQIYPLASSFDAELVEAMADIFTRTPCYALSYDVPADGAALLAQVFAA